MIKACVVCGTGFDARASAKTCSHGCSRTLRCESYRRHNYKRVAANPSAARESARRRERDRAAKLRAANPDAVRKRDRDKQAKWRAANPERSREKYRQYATNARITRAQIATRQTIAQMGLD